MTGAGPDGAIDKLPQAIVAREDALRMARALSAGQTLRARLDLPNRVSGPIEQANVVGEIRGREQAAGFVVLGAHLDSWELGTGALDNGCNAALVVEAARDIHLTGLRPRRSIRFVLFSGEEQWMLGSAAYVKAAPARNSDRTVAAIFFDDGSGRVTGFSLGGRRDIEPAVLQALDPVKSWSVGRNTDDAFVGTDNFDFLLEGVPNLVANQEAASYIVNYHAASDSFDKVDLVYAEGKYRRGGGTGFQPGRIRQTGRAAAFPRPNGIRAETDGARCADEDFRHVELLGESNA